MDQVHVVRHKVLVEGRTQRAEPLAGAMIKSQDTILICPTIAAQEGAISALEVGRAYCEPFVRERSGPKPRAESPKPIAQSL